jgi:hypothetical protein
MKKLLFLLSIILVFITACSDGDMSDINGMWQLKTIEDAGNHTVQPVDTIFYAFQRQSIFSYTILYEDDNNPATALQIYGFIDFPDNDHLHIQLDKAYHWRAPYVLWQDTAVIYDIVRLDSKSMILSQGGSIYNFKKH